MDIKDFNAITTKITQNLSNQALVTELLTQLIDDYSETQNNITNLNTQTQTYQNEISALQKTNMNLFLKLSSPVPEDGLKKPEPLQYEELVKGMIK
jgi:uncharacterized protein YlxW (UPF0749 family)